MPTLSMGRPLRTHDAIRYSVTDLPMAARKKKDGWVAVESFLVPSGNWRTDSRSKAAT